MRNVLDSDIANYIVQKTQKEAKEDLVILFGGVLKMTKGISNFQIEEEKTSSFKNIEDKDINNNFVGVFPWNYMNKFTDHAAMISEKRQNTHLPKPTLKKGELTRGVHSILSQKQTFSSLTRLVWTI